MWRRSAGLWKPGEGRTERWNKAGMARGMKRVKCSAAGAKERGKGDASAAEGGLKSFKVISVGRK